MKRDLNVPIKLEFMLVNVSTNQAVYDDNKV